MTSAPPADREQDPRLEPEAIDPSPVIRIPAGRWEAFRAWLERTPERNPGLARLLRLVPPWEP